MSDLNVFMAEPATDYDPDEVFLEPFDPYEYGVGLNASRYSDYLRDKKGIDNDCYIQCHGWHGGSVEEGIVAFDKTDTVPPLRFVVGFNQDEDNPFEYTSTVSGEILTDDEADKDALLDLFYGLNLTSIPFTSTKNLILLLRVEKTDCGVRLYYTQNIGKCSDGIGKREMELIYKQTFAIASYIDKKIQEFK